jgi:hypothetical protein
MQVAENHRVLKPHARLTEEEVLEIFRIRAAAPSAVKIAACYGISEKAVRDIWTARTWSRETSHLDPTRNVEPKQIGRPKGRTDSKPRKRRVDAKWTAPRVDSRSLGGALEIGKFQGDRVAEQELDNSFCKKINPSNIKVVLPASDDSRPAFVCSSRGASVDDQLYEWDEKFWTSSTNHDPFYNDWHPYFTDVLGLRKS